MSAYPFFIISLLIGIFFFVLVIIWQKIQAPVENARFNFSPEPGGKVGDIPVMACWRGRKGKPYFGYRMISSTAWHLELFTDHIQYLWLRSDRKSRYEDISYVDVKRNNFLLLARDFIEFQFHNDPFTFIGCLNNARNLKELLKFLSFKKVPLSEKAQAMLVALDK